MPKLPTCTVTFFFTDVSHFADIAGRARGRLSKGWDTTHGARQQPASGRVRAA
jgi:hypothetical protein